MTVRVFAWNSQGYRLDYFLKKFLPAYHKGDPDGFPLLAYFCEAGEWRDSKNIKKVKEIIDVAIDIKPTVAGKTKYLKGLYYQGAWAGWQKHGKNKNLRCSVAMLEIQKKDKEFCWTINHIPSDNKEGNIRPIMRAKSEIAIIYGLHFVAVQSSAEKDLEIIAPVLSNDSGRLPFLAVGDMNFNLKSFELPKEFENDNKILSTFEATQQSGGELDWGFGQGFDVLKSKCVVAMGVIGDDDELLGSVGLGDSPSDHAALLYDIDLGKMDIE